MSNNFRTCPTTGLKVDLAAENLIKANAVVAVVFLLIGLGRFYLIGFSALMAFDTLAQLSFKTAGMHALPLGSWRSDVMILKTSRTMSGASPSDGSSSISSRGRPIRARASATPRSAARSSSSSCMPTSPARAAGRAR